MDNIDDLLGWICLKGYSFHGKTSIKKLREMFQKGMFSQERVGIKRPSFNSFPFYMRPTDPNTSRGLVINFWSPTSLG
jgi:peptidyl-tRNA hydrolase